MHVRTGPCPQGLELDLSPGGAPQITAPGASPGNAEACGPILSPGGAEQPLEFATQSPLNPRLHLLMRQKLAAVKLRSPLLDFANEPVLIIQGTAKDIGRDRYFVRSPLLSELRELRLLLGRQMHFHHCKVAGPREPINWPGTHAGITPLPELSSMKIRVSTSSGEFQTGLLTARLRPAGEVCDEPGIRQIPCFSRGFLQFDPEPFEMRPYRDQAFCTVKEYNLMQVGLSPSSHSTNRQAVPAWSIRSMKLPGPFGKVVLLAELATTR